MARIKRVRKVKIEAPTEAPTERPLEVEVSECSNCNKKYDADGAKLCPQCRQV